MRFVSAQIFPVPMPNARRYPADAAAQPEHEALPAAVALPGAAFRQT